MLVLFNQAALDPLSCTISPGTCNIVRILDTHLKLDATIVAAAWTDDITEEMKMNE